MYIYRIVSLFSSVDRAPEQCSVPGRSLVKLRNKKCFLVQFTWHYESIYDISPGKFALWNGAQDVWNRAFDDGWRYILTRQRRLGTRLYEHNYFSANSTFLAVCCKHVTYKPLPSHDGLVQHVLRRRKCLNSRFMEAVNKPRWNFLSLSGLG